jgi:CheY-like chemotaxis protein
MSLFAFNCDNGKKIGNCPQLVRAGMSNIKPIEAPIEAKKQVRVLVVDDEAGVIRMTKRILDKKKCASVGAESGKAALEILKGEKFDVIILDYNLLDMTGLQLFEMLSQEDKGKVIFNTGISANSGALAGTGRPVLIKPYGMEELYREVSAVAGPLE